jgi:inosine/xanthosine triphosphate pyrophosphatase family protein
MLFVEFFNVIGEQWELHGLDTKRWLRQMGLDGFLGILGNTNRRKAKFVSQTGAYFKSEKYFYGRGEVCGSISYKKAEVLTPQYGTYPYFFHLLFIPD